jgi:glycosyltransferase involved in cell wall biosynthesis
MRESGRLLAQFLGFIKGDKAQDQVDIGRQKTLNGAYFILSGIPIDDTGGGARCTQIALELLRQDYMVVFVNKYPKYESRDLNLQINHPNLFTASLKRFSISKFIHSYKELLSNKPIGVLVEFPLGDFLPIIRNLNTLGAVTVYDLLDDWDTSLGSRWYSLEVEKQIMSESRVLVATAPVLKERLEKLSNRPVKLLPNAVNLNLFDDKRTYSRPDDLPQGEWTILFFGALWGDWFDWELLVKIAKEYPSANLVLIGDYRGQCPQDLPNIHFLGLKAQQELPAYLAYSEVTFIPWKVNEITLATSPVKVYEFLAMHKPVVAPDLPLLHEIPFVLCSQDHQDFIDNIERARETPIGGEKLESFLEENSWSKRVDYLTAQLESPTVKEA